MSSTNADLDAIITILEAVNQSLNIDQILKIALDEVLKLKGLDAGTIRLMDDEATTLILKAYRGFSPLVIKKLKTIKLGEKFAGIAAQSPGGGPW
jgi:hypothetical protein